MPGRNCDGREAEDFAETPIDDFQPMLAVIEAETLRHIVERGVEKQVCRFQLCFLLFQTR